MLKKGKPLNKGTKGLSNSNSGLKKKSYFGSKVDKKFLDDYNNLKNEIWNERKHICVSCDKKLGNEPKAIYFEHWLEKNLYKEYALDKDNIFLVCEDCHANKNAGFPTEKYREIGMKAEEILRQKNNPQ